MALLIAITRPLDDVGANVWPMVEKLDSVPMYAAPTRASAGTIVHKGQSLFKVTPDERVVDVDQKAVAKAKREKTDALLARVG